MENMPATEANAFKNRCSRCFQCPVCFTTLQIHLFNYKNQKFYHFGCQSCYWDSINIDLRENSLNELFLSNQERFGKDNTMQDKFKSLLEVYKESSKNKKKNPIRHPSLKQN